MSRAPPTGVRDAGDRCRGRGTEKYFRPWAQDVRDVSGVTRVSRLRCAPRHQFGENPAICAWLAECSRAEACRGGPRVTSVQEDSPMRRIIIWSAPVVLAALALSGCLATRNWVSENLGKHQAPTDERF